VGVAITDAQGGNIRQTKPLSKYGQPRPSAVSISDYGAYKAWWSETGKPVARRMGFAQAVAKGEAIVDSCWRFSGLTVRMRLLSTAAPIFDVGGKIAGCAVLSRTSLICGRRRGRCARARKDCVDVETSQIGIGFGDSTDNLRGQ